MMISILLVPHQVEKSVRLNASSSTRPQLYVTIRSAMVRSAESGGGREREEWWGGGRGRQCGGSGMGFCPVASVGQRHVLGCWLLQIHGMVSGERCSSAAVFSPYTYTPPMHAAAVCLSTSLVSPFDSLPSPPLPAPALCACRFSPRLSPFMVSLAPSIPRPAAPAPRRAWPTSRCARVFSTRALRRHRTSSRCWHQSSASRSKR